MNILFVHNEPATFVRIDLDLLRSAHTVRELYVERRGAGQMAGWAAGLPQQVRWADLIFGWFGGYHLLLPCALGRALGRACVVVASGYDVAAMPEIGYGNMRGGPRRVIGRQVFALADRVLAVSHFTRSEAMRNAGVPAAKLRVVPHGLDAGRFQPGPASARVPQVLTVGGATPATVRTKGLHEFAALAARFPALDFLVVGRQKAQTAAELRAIGGPNLKLLGPQQGNDLVALMQGSAVYAQLSAYESFGMALAEAMLCGCVPLVTDRGALPEVAGPGAFVAPYGDLAAYACALERALAAGPEAGEAARRHIAAEYPLERRRQTLLAVLEEVREEVGEERRANGAATR